MNFSSVLRFAKASALMPSLSNAALGADSPAVASAVVLLSLTSEFENSFALTSLWLSANLISDRNSALAPVLTPSLCIASAASIEPFAIAPSPPATATPANAPIPDIAPLIALNDLPSRFCSCLPCEAALSIPALNLAMFAETSISICEAISYLSSVALNRAAHTSVCCRSISFCSSSLPVAASVLCLEGIKSEGFICGVTPPRLATRAVNCANKSLHCISKGGCPCHAAPHRNRSKVVTSTNF